MSAIKICDNVIEYPDPESKRSIMFNGPCQNSCVFCYEGKRDKEHFNISKKELRDLIKEGRDKGKRSLHFSGYCEPSLYPHLLESIRYAKSIGYKNIYISTNGRTFKNLRYLKELVDAGLNKINFSIHGHNPALVDSMTRSEGSFLECLAGIKNALYLRKKGNLSISALVTITKLNVKYLPQIVVFFSRLGVEHISLSEFSPIGSGFENYKKIRVDRKELLHYIKKAVIVADRCHQKINVKIPQNDLLDGIRKYSNSMRFDGGDALAIFNNCKRLTSNEIYTYFGKECLDCSMNSLCNCVYSTYKSVIRDKSITSVDLREFYFKKNFKRNLTEFFNKLKKPVAVILSNKTYALFLSAVGCAESNNINHLSIDFTDSLFLAKDIEILNDRATNFEIILSLGEHLLDNLKFLNKNAGSVNFSLEIYLSKENINYFGDRHFLDLLKKLRKKGMANLILAQKQRYAGNKNYLVSLYSHRTTLGKFLGYCSKNSIKFTIRDIPFCYFDNKLKKSFSSGFDITRNYNPTYIDLKDRKINYNLFFPEATKNLRHKKNKCGFCKHRNNCPGELEEVIRFFGFYPKPIRAKPGIN
ncbi:radical SAM protein [Candidatus Woesearchaeota archaeon]|nr:radical SAM protein [Candidatus Woesearchaeota archaeon]